MAECEVAERVGFWVFLEDGSMERWTLSHGTCRDLSFASMVADKCELEAPAKRRKQIC